MSDGTDTSVYALLWNQPGVSQSLRVMIPDDPAASLAPAEDQPSVADQHPSFPLRADRFAGHISLRLLRFKVQFLNLGRMDAHGRRMIRKRNPSADLAQMKPCAKNPDSLKVRAALDGGGGWGED